MRRQACPAACNSVQAASASWPLTGTLCSRKNRPPVSSRRDDAHRSRQGPVEQRRQPAHFRLGRRRRAERTQLQAEIAGTFRRGRRWCFGCRGCQGSQQLGGFPCLRRVRIIGQEALQGRGIAGILRRGPGLVPLEFEDALLGRCRVVAVWMLLEETLVVIDSIAELGPLPASNFLQLNHACARAICFFAIRILGEKLQVTLVRVLAFGELPRLVGVAAGGEQQTQDQQQVTRGHLVTIASCVPAVPTLCQRFHPLVQSRAIGH